MSYMTQAIFHLRENGYQDVKLLFQTWDSLKIHGPFYENAMKLYPEYGGTTFFLYLEKNRDSFISYIEDAFWKEMKTFIEKTHYNGDDLFRRKMQDV